MQRLNGSVSYRLATAIALGATVLLVWLSLGVGIIGADGDPANRMYVGVLVIGIVGSVIARLHPRGMAFTLFAMALAQGAIAVIAVSAGLGRPWSGPAELALLNGFFVAAFVAAGLLYRRASQGQPDPRQHPGGPR